MAQPSNEIRDILVQSRTERQALFGPVSEVSRRLQPRHLADVSTHYAKQKVATALGGISDAVQENGGIAAAVALGAVAVFDAGRRSADGKVAAGRVEVTTATVTSDGDADARSSGYHAGKRRAVANLDRAKMIAGSAVGVLVGHIIGRAFPPTAKEHALFGEAADEIRDAAAQFVSEHKRGAKIAAAEAFGFARYGATFLAVLAVASDYFVSKEDIRDPSEK
ncbi:hypothetical protein FJV83_29540 [Mesorhizobium sp. WSM4307]|uniref:hypothetical protein n=1 Tax=unclassified Mesorhizobium TaxID=325217 RepID=UPI00115E55A2|nr:MULTISPECIES: hypothetical protein [unclassified Mesorhizobium]TRC77989.1 hypothetical protein FJV81_10360 [Mesorhizobium sp. WSM4315]TRC78614.1 hypothetical protein FJV83_29540 [Mesorhizobium sp. WSM4307]TRC80241.1 hypothetical protein FJV80_23060 [Mesorhizobium sp. WSM4310]